MAGVDSLALEVTPGHLKLVSDCTEAELIAAGLTLMTSEAPDDVWDAQFAVLTDVYRAKLIPTAEARAARFPRPFTQAMALLPEGVRQEAARRWRIGLDALNARSSYDR